MNESKNNNQSNFAKFDANADNVKNDAEKNDGKTDTPKPEADKPKNDHKPK
jgi:hypothetical protein